MLKVYPSDANFLLLELVNGLTAMELGERLMGMGMLIRDCSNFTGLSAHFFRIAVRTKEENDLLVSGLKQILEQEG
jgi:histidinol-phosphate/aromatic aminotransferase/cobyric acid decarboxylase-like protein